MVGPISVNIKSNKIAYEFVLYRKYTILSGDSGTGKTTLFDLIMAHKNGVAAIKISCKYTVTGVNKESDVIRTVSKCHNSIIVIDELTLNEIDMSNTYKIMKDTDNFYLFITRERLSEIPISITELYKTQHVGGVNTFVRMYNHIKYTDTFVPDVVITEDSGAGYKFYKYLCNNSNRCITARGKNNIKAVTETWVGAGNNVMIIADGAAFGSEIEGLVKLKKEYGKIRMFMPECFEYVILNLSILKKISYVQDVLADEIRHIDTRYNSWEQFYIALLKDVTKDTDITYSKSKLNKCYVRDCCYKGNRCTNHTNANRFAEIEALLSSFDLSTVRMYSDDKDKI